MFKQLQVAFTSPRRRQAARFSTAVASAGTIVAVAATSAFGAGAPGASARPSRQPKAPISGAAAFVLPSSAQCVKGGRITVQLRKIRHVGWSRVVVTVNGRRFTTIPSTQVNRPVQISGLPTGAISFSITAQTRDHRSVTAGRHYHSCATTPTTPPKSTTPTPQPKPTPPAPPTAPQPGLYRTNGGYVLFYVSPDGAHVQDMTKSTSLTCSTGGGFGSSISIDDIPIAADGSFEATQVEGTIISGKPAKITTTFSGNFHGTEASGAYREDVEYEDGSGKTCTTNTQSWPALVESSQGSQLLAPPQPGLYRTNGGYVLFYVSADHAHIQDVTKSTSLSCDTGASFGSSISITDIPIEGQSTFKTTQVESGLISGKPVTITTTFQGHFHGLDGAGNQRAAGTYREDVVYQDGSGEECTTGTQSWPASVESGQGSQTLASPQPGLYRTNGGYALFYVSPDGGHIQDVTASTSLTCSTGGGIGSSISIEDIPIEGQSTFKTTQVESTIISGKPVKITTIFKGHFHGHDGSGNQRAAGTYREDVEYEDGSGKTCTTNTQSWPALVEGGQGSQLLAPPQAGIYRTNGGYVLFHVSADHAHIQDVTKSTSLSCDTGASFGSSISITDIPIEGQSTFRKTQVENGLISGKPVKITVTFNGHFHGFDGAGNQRAAGVYREDVVFEDGSGEECTTGTQSWPAGWSSS